MITPLDILSLETWILLMSILALMRLYIHKKWQVLKNLNIPHEPPSILGLGNLKDLMKNPDAFFEEDLIKKKKFGTIYGSYFGLQPRISISDPEILKQIFIKEFSVFRDRQRTLNTVNGKIMNNALTVVSGQQWKRIRNTLSPTFSTSKLKEMATIIENCTKQMIDKMEVFAKEKNGRFSTKDVFGKLSMDVICSAAFSTNVHSQDDGESKEVEIARKLFDQTVFQNPLVALCMVFPWIEKLVEKTNFSLFGDDVTNYFSRMVDVLIKSKKSREKPRVDIMQQMLKNEISDEDVKKGAEKGITRNETVGNAILMITAGYETTMNTLVFLAYSLATNKGIQRRVQQEIDETVENFGKITYEGLNNMKYLDMCMNESQRLYGALPRNGRYCHKDITINGIHIPAGTQIDIPIYGLHHDEEYWDEPWEYKPERFEDMSKIDPIIFQPFGAGPRNCIGMRFAILEVKMAISKILLNFNLDVCEDTPESPLRTQFKASLQPRDEVFLKVVPKTSTAVKT